MIPNFPSGCTAIDGLLSNGDNGLPFRCILEVSGPPGSGKTKLAMSVALNSWLERAMGHLSSDLLPDVPGVLIVDTDGSLPEKNIRETLQLMVQYNEYPEDVLETAMHNVYYQRLTSLPMFIAFLDQLDTWLHEHPEVKVVVIDSVSSLVTREHAAGRMRREFSNFASEVFSNAVHKHDAAVIATHQLVPAKSKGLAPLLESSFLPERALRLVLYYNEEGERCATLINKSTTVFFAVDALGVCDVVG